MFGLFYSVCLGTLLLIKPQSPHCSQPQATLQFHLEILTALDNKVNIQKSDEVYQHKHGNCNILDTMIQGRILTFNAGLHLCRPVNFMWPKM